MHGSNAIHAGSLGGPWVKPVVHGWARHYARHNLHPWPWVTLAPTLPYCTFHFVGSYLRASSLPCCAHSAQLTQCGCLLTGTSPSGSTSFPSTTLILTLPARFAPRSYPALLTSWRWQMAPRPCSYQVLASWLTRTSLHRPRHECKARHHHQHSHQHSHQHHHQHGHQHRRQHNRHQRHRMRDRMQVAALAPKDSGVLAALLQLRMRRRVLSPQNRAAGE